MKNILVLGAGFSSADLIKYLLDHSSEYDWHIRVGDVSVDEARAKTRNHPRAEAMFLNVDDNDLLSREVKRADVVVSMLPAKFHIRVAGECIRFGTHFISASYVTPEMENFHNQALENDVLLLNEMGVDPGIDHMSAMQGINKIRNRGHQLIAFESATGGLVAPDHDNNPWNYKFTWNPGNVVRAGQRGARFLHNGKFKHIPYHRLFERYEIIDIPGFGQFEVYPNRDSLKYQQTYGLSDLLTMFRGTIRRPGFCDAWNLLVQLGATDDSYQMEGTEKMSYRQFTNSFLAYNIIDPVEKKLANYLNIKEDSELMHKLKWLGLFDETRIGIPDLTPAQVLQHILEKKWAMDPDDKDMIIMQHQFDYIHLGSHRKLYSTMVVIGEPKPATAMSKTVGLPIAIATRLLLLGKIKLRGVRLPVHEEIYEPVMEELRDFGIRFEERDTFVS